MMNEFDEFQKKMTVYSQLCKRGLRFVKKFFRTYPRMAPGTSILLVILGSVFIYQHYLITATPNSSAWLDMFAITTSNFSLSHLVLATVTHKNLSHLLSNAVGLFVLGWIIEHYLPPLSYIIVFFCGSFVGIFGFLMAMPPGWQGIGASAGVYFLSGFALLYLGFPFFSKKIYNIPFLIPSFYTVLTVGIGLTVFFTMLLTSGFEIGHIAHFISWVCGFLFGLVTASNSEMDLFTKAYTKSVVSYLL